MTTQINGNTGVSLVQGGAVNGVADSSSAPTGFVGEYVEATRAFASPLAMTSATPAGIVSISLTAGDWDVQGRLGLITAATTTVGGIAAYIDTAVSLFTNDTVAMSRENYQNVAINTLANGAPSLSTGVTRISIAATTTVYLVGYVGFSTSTASCFGSIHARRVR